jgi:FKBP-type peptidyl-prolyl cis-trans isomerase 2
MRFIIRMLSSFCAAAVALSFSAVFAADATPNNKVVKDGSVVSLQYTLTGEDGKQIESNKGKDPLKFTQGSHQIIPGLEKSLAGMKVGDEKHVKVAAKDAYGEVDPRAIQEVPKDKIPPNGLKIGAVLMASGPQGQPIPVTVKEVKEKTVVIDLNHPMAGKNLVFDVKVLDVQPPSTTSTTAPAAAAPAPKPAQSN